MITRAGLADEIDTYDQSIADLNAGKKDCFDAYRDQLLAAGIAKPNIKKEIEAVKEAIRRRRLVAKDKGAVEEKDKLVDEVLAEISAPVRAPRARVENIEQFPPHNPETGELTDTQEQPETANEIPAGSHDQRHELVAGPEDQLEKEPLVAAGVVASVSASFFPSVAPPADTVALESQAPRPDATVSIPNPQEPNSSPAADSPASTSSPEPGSLSEADVPAFLKSEQRKSIADYRPNCLNPDACGATGLQHCYTCRNAMEAVSETEAAA